jgi:hypothetical protein
MRQYDVARTDRYGLRATRFGAQVSGMNSPEHYHALLISELAR